MDETQILEAPGGNLYHPHPLMIDSGTFWRCKHGTTGFKGNLEWVGCLECANEDPEAFAKFHKKTK